MHRLGVHATIEQVASEDDASGELLHESLSWSEPPLDALTPARELASGGLRIRCEYDNTTDEPVWFGEGLDDEMCAFWAYYYPSRGFLVGL